MQAHTWKTRGPQHGSSARIVQWDTIVHRAQLPQLSVQRMYLDLFCQTAILKNY